MSAAATLPVLQPHPWLGLMAYLLLVIALILLSAWLARHKRAGSSAAHSLRVRAQLALGLREKLVIVQVDGRRLLLGLTPGRIQLLTELAAADEQEATDEAVSFAVRLRELMQRGGV